MVAKLISKTSSCIRAIIVCFLNILDFLIHDDALLISFSTKPRTHVVSVCFFHISCWCSFSSSPLGTLLHFECEALGSIDQQNVIMYKAYYASVTASNNLKSRLRARKYNKCMKATGSTDTLY